MRSYTVSRMHMSTFTFTCAQVYSLQLLYRDAVIVGIDDNATIGMFQCRFMSTLFKNVNARFNV